MSEKIELKPCPFCGGEAARHKLADTYVDRQFEHFIKCRSCGIRTAGVYAHEDDGSGAIRKITDAWNTRTGADQ